MNKNIELGEKRLQKDEAGVKILIEQFARFRVFSRSDTNLVNITTNDVVQSGIREDILNAENNGSKIIEKIISFINTSEFYKPIKKNNIKSFSHIKIAKCQSKGPHNSLKKGQQIIQRLLSIAEQRDIDTKHIYSYELTDYPMSLAVNECLSTPNNQYFH